MEEKQNLRGIINHSGLSSAIPLPLLAPNFLYTQLCARNDRGARYAVIYVSSRTDTTYFVSSFAWKVNHALQSELYIRICTVFSMKIYCLTRLQRHDVWAIYVGIICYKAQTLSPWCVIGLLFFFFFQLCNMSRFTCLTLGQIGNGSSQTQFWIHEIQHDIERYEKERCACHASRKTTIRTHNHFWQPVSLCRWSKRSRYPASDSMPVNRSTGKKEVADKKKKRKCTLGNNNNRGRRHRQKYGAAGAAHRATRQGSRCLMFKSAITRSFGDICHCRCQPATQSI